MLKYYFYYLVFLIPFTSCKKAVQPSTSTTAPITFQQIVDLYYQDKLKLLPIEATLAGINDYNDRMPIEISDSFRDTLKQFYTKYLGLLSNTNLSISNTNDSISFQLLKWDLDMGLAGLEFHDNYMPINQFNCQPLVLGQFASGESAQPFHNTKDYDNWLKRISIFPQWADTAIANMNKGINMKWVLPKSLVVKVLPQLKEIAEKETEKNLYYLPVIKLKDNSEISDIDKQRLTEAYKQMVEQQIKPAFKRLHDYMEHTYLPAARTSSGISSLPNGEKYYTYLVKLQTTSTLSPNEIFELGKQEVARIRNEMESIKLKCGFHGSLKEFFNYVIHDEKKLRPFTKPEEVIENFKSIHDKSSLFVEQQFDLMPETEFEIRRTEAFREASASAEYVQGSLENNRPGIFYVPIPDVSQYNVFQDESLFLHEAIPGHHFQIALQQENKSLPAFRKNIGYNAYQEGWALYCESLGKELNLYDDPYQYFGRLGNEMHRALRLVIDVGLHMKKWTREEAINYDLENEADSEANIIAEVERYMAWPGQALGYKIGELKIQALKKKAKATMGEKFNIQQFHNELLNAGSLPLSVLEEKIERYINR